MDCAEVMKGEVQCCHESDPVALVAERMRSCGIGFVPVCDDRGVVVGTLTDRDLVIRVLADQRPPATTLARDVMSRSVVCCRPADDLSVAELLMSQHKKSRIVCVDERARPVGVISLSDVAARETGKKSGAILRSVAQRESRQ